MQLMVMLLTLPWMLRYVFIYPWILRCVFLDTQKIAAWEPLQPVETDENRRGESKGVRASEIGLLLEVIQVLLLFL